jgi:1,4-alpha-glucan branching enzyme
VGTFSAPDAHAWAQRLVWRALPYLRDLGINFACELLPTTGFQAGATTHTVCAGSDYGGPCIRMVKRAHQHGISWCSTMVYVQPLRPRRPWTCNGWFDGWRKNDDGGIYFYNDWRAGNALGDNLTDFSRPGAPVHPRQCPDVAGTTAATTCGPMPLPSSVNGEDPGADLPEGWSLMRWINGNRPDHALENHHCRTCATPASR